MHLIGLFLTYHPEYTMHTVQNGGSRIMLCGFFSLAQTGELVRFKVKINRIKPRLTLGDNPVGGLRLIEKGSFQF